MKRFPATTVYYWLSFGAGLPTWVVMSVYLVQELQLTPLQLVLPNIDVIDVGDAPLPDAGRSCTRYPHRHGSPPCRPDE